MVSQFVSEKGMFETSSTRLPEKLEKEQNRDEKTRPGDSIEHC